MADLNPQVTELFLEAVEVASKDASPVLPMILRTLEKTKNYNWWWDSVNENLIVAIRPHETVTGFACHTDTISPLAPVIPILDEDTGIVSTAGQFSSCLGADDRAGITVLLYLILNDIPGYYFFFGKEEIGCKGSEAWAKRFENLPVGAEVMIDYLVSFDRKGKDEIITHQRGVRTCSDDFALALAAEMNAASPHLHYSPAISGGRTDSHSARLFIPECTNIAMGYEKPHSKSETQDLEYLSAICEAALAVQWDELPVVRDPQIIEETPKAGTQKAKKKETKKDDDGHGECTLIRYWDKKGDLPEYDLESVAPVDVQTFIGFAEERLDKFIPSFFDDKQHRRAMVKMLDFGFRNSISWAAVIDRALENKLDEVGLVNKHFIMWVEGQVFKWLSEFARSGRACMRLHKIEWGTGKLDGIPLDVGSDMTNDPNADTALYIG